MVTKKGKSLDEIIKEYRDHDNYNIFFKTDTTSSMKQKKINWVTLVILLVIVFTLFEIIVLVIYMFTHRG